jgi:hypothetical protein
MGRAQSTKQRHSTQCYVCQQKQQTCYIEYNDGDQYGLEVTLIGLGLHKKMHFTAFSDHDCHTPKDTIVCIYIATFTLLNGLLHTKRMTDC